jgi:hypothetical protein
MLKMFCLAPKAVTLATIPEQITTSDIPCSTVIFQAQDSNTGLTYVGDSSVGAQLGVALDPGEVFSISADQSGRNGEELLLSDFWVDAENDGNVLKISYIKRR